MDYLRSILPTSSAKSSDIARPHLSPHHSEDSDAALLTPPQRDDDPNDPPPFVPAQDDHTSLSQIEPGTPRMIDAAKRPRLYQHRSTSSAPGSLEERQRSEPIPIPPLSYNDIPHRRNTVHAGKLPRPLHHHRPNSPLTRSPSGDDNEDQEDRADLVGPDEVFGWLTPSATVSIEDRRRSSASVSAVIDQWLADADEFRSPCLEHIHQLPSRVLTLPANPEVPDVTDDDADIDASAHGLQPSDNLDDFEGFSGAYPLERADTDPPISVPLEIRLRRASSKQQELKRRSLPTLRSPYMPPVMTDYDSRRPSRPEIMSWKSSPAPTALTHAWTSKSRPGQYLQDSSESTSNRLSTTLQVVQSRDSVYEVIWEDNVVAGSGYTPRAPTLNYFEPTPLSPIMSEGTRDEPDSLESNMAAWYWASSEDNNDSAMQSLSESLSRSNESRQVPQPREAGSRSQSRDSSRRVPHESSHSRSPSISPDESPGQPEVDQDTVRDQPGEEQKETSITRMAPQPRRASTPTINAVIDAGERTPSPIANVAPSAITAQKRRELLGNRKISNMSSESEHFGGHRDSLVLAHKRIFHEQMEKMHDVYGEEAHDPHLEDLRRTTWHKKRAKDDAEGEPLHELRSMSPVKEEDVHGILVHEAAAGERPPAVKSRSGKHIHLVVEGESDKT